MRCWVALRVLVRVIAVCVVGVGGLAVLHATPAASAADCASLGEAANFVAFSNGDFNASPAGGENITGRIAAAVNVMLGGAGSGGVYVSPAAGDSAPIVIAGANFSAGESGSGGSLNGGVSYGNSISVAPNFYVNGQKTHAAPPFTFADQFEALRSLSASLADLDQTPGASVSLNQNSHALELTGTGGELNVFTVSAAQLTQAAGVVINLTQPGATALINVTTDTQQTVSLQYMDLAGTASAADIAWNLPLATELTVSGSVAWQGLVLAPNAEVNLDSNGQFNGQLIASTIPAASRTLTKAAFTGCLPPPQPPAPPDESLTLTSLCVNAVGDLAMRLRNTGDSTRRGNWVDLGGTDFGRFDVPAHSDDFFDVQDPTEHSVISATSGTTTVTAPATLTSCQGQITVQLQTVGPAPVGATWNIGLDAGVEPSPVITLASGGSDTITVPGGYVNGTAPIDQVVGGVTYTISLQDTHDGTATVSLNPVEIIDGQHQIVTVTITYSDSGGAGTPEIESPDQPTLPPGAPAPLPGPDLNAGASGADLSITHQVTPRRLPAGGTVVTLTRVRNLGPEPAVGVVAREIPQYRPEQANSVVHVLALTTTQGTCNSRRPVHCRLGTLAPGATVTIRTRARILIAAPLRSIVVVSSDTPDPNTANNVAIALVTTFVPKANIHAHVSAPAVTRVTSLLSYTVSVTGGGKAGASTVRLCTKPPSSLIQVHAPGTFAYRGQRCRTVNRLGRGRSLSFTVSGLASARGRLFPFARATAVGVARPSRASTQVLVLGPPAPCLAGDQAMTGRAPPTLHVAC